MYVHSSINDTYKADRENEERETWATQETLDPLIFFFLHSIIIFYFGGKSGIYTPLFLVILYRL